MKKQYIVGGIIVLFLVTGFLIYRVMSTPKAQEEVTSEEESSQTEDVLPPVDDSVKIEVTTSTTEDNTVVIKATGLDNKMSSVAYELTYESEGLLKGVNSGSKPIDVAGEDSFERDVYLGTCSRNVCRPDPGVQSVSLVLQFTDTEGKKSQFTGDFEL